MSTLLKFFTVVSLAVSMGPSVARCDDHRFLSPGVKLGYTFGPSGGFTYGFEVSYVVWSKEDYIYGLVIDWDRCGKRTKLHIGGEIGIIAGIDVGPTLIWEQGEAGAEPGVTLTPYFGAIVPYVFYSYTYRLERGTSINELGGFLKVPISVGKPFEWID